MAGRYFNSGVASAEAAPRAVGQARWMVADRGRKGFFFLASPEEKGGGALGCRMLSLFVSRRQPDATILNLR